MNKKEIERIRRKFIKIAMLSFLAVMLFIGGIINTVSVVSSRSAIRDTLESIIQYEGVFQENPERFSDAKPASPSIKGAFSTDFRFNHYFLFSTDDGIITALADNTDNTYEEVAAESYADAVSELNGDFGRYGSYYYLKGENADGKAVLALIDCTTELDASMRLHIATVATCVAALIIAFVLVNIFSGEMVKPEIENGERQKEFITNASHELKTPLAVIKANTELLEASGGENEWTQSTLKQVDHMNGLIQNMVMIARAEEKENGEKTQTLDASRIVKETVAPYEALIAQEGKQLIRNIEESVQFTGEESKFRQLTTILIDNAVKYCDDGSVISVSLTALRKGKSGLKLTVTNSFAEGKSTDVNRFFDRFYRDDSSHNIDKGGYGIGLSLAQSICEQAGGSIKAVWKDGQISFIVQIP